MSTILLEEPVLLVLKATLLLSAGGLLTVAARGAPASIRHLVWAATLIGLLVLPLLALGLPRWTLPVLPADPAATVSVMSEATPAPVAEVGGADHARSLPGSVAAPAPEAPAGSPAPWPDLHPLLLLWAAGSLAVLGWVLLGQLGVQRLRRRAQPVRNAEWLREAHDLSWLLDITRPVALLRGTATATPMTWGILWPTVLLPDEAEEWGEDRRRMVLLHELAHVRRKDCLTQLAAHLACALFWFHPLAWYAARRLRVERERACDDMVVRAGASAPDYADHLLHVARTLKAPRASGTAVAMARPGQLEGRLLAVLDPERRRGSAAWTTRAAALAGLAALTVAVAVVHPGEVSANEIGREAEGAEQPMAELPAGAIRSEDSEVAAEARSGSNTGQAAALLGQDLQWQGTVRRGGTLAVYNMNGAVRATGTGGSTARIRGSLAERRGNQREVHLAYVQHAGGTTVCILPEGAECTAEGIRGADRETLRGRNQGPRTANLTVEVPEGVALRTETLNGALHLEDIGGDVHAVTLNGAIEASGVGSVQAKTLNGAIDVAMGRTAWTGDLSLETLNGAVRVRLPADASTTVSASTMAGSITSDFPLDVARRPARSTASGTIGAGGRSLTLSTMNGAIHIERAGGPLPGAVSSAGAPSERSGEKGWEAFAASMEAFGEAMGILGATIGETVGEAVGRSFGAMAEPPAPPEDGRR